MFELLALHRAMQMFAHSAHNLCARALFHQDHEFFGDLYGAAEGRYDSIAEKIIGTQGEDKLALQQIMAAVSQKLQNAPSVGVKENKVFYAYALDMSKQALAMIEQLNKAGQLSQGTINMLADQADKIEVEVYKIKQRLK